MSADESLHQGRMKSIVILVVVAIALLGGGVVLLWMKKSGQLSEPAVAETSNDELIKWCAIRKEWAEKVNPMSGDIMLKSVKEEDRAVYKELLQKRDEVCREFGKKIETMTITDPRIGAVEQALIREGKMRANISVEIHNQTTQLVLDDAKVIRKAQDQLEGYIVKRIAAGQADADQSISQALVGMKQCEGIYRGPMTDQDTSDSPYITWEELEFRRKAALSDVNRRIKDLEPYELLANRVEGMMLQNYRGDLKKCFDRVKKQVADLPTKLDLQVRLKISGQVQTLAVKDMNANEERILDCLLETASRWRLPKPFRDQQAMTVTVDFAKL